MTINVNPRYAQSFERLLIERGINEPAAFMNIAYFDEEPVYTRYGQLDFLSQLSFTEANKLLIRATALHLEKIAMFAERSRGTEARTILRMVSIQGWMGDPFDQPNYDGSTGFLLPNIWCANLDDPRLNGFPVWPAASVAGAFVREAMKDDQRFSIAESRLDKFGAPVPSRVYIYMPGSEGTDRLSHRF